MPYSVSIAAVNRAGLGELSTVITFTQELSKLFFIKYVATLFNADCIIFYSSQYCSTGM